MITDPVQIPNNQTPSNNNFLKKVLHGRLALKERVKERIHFANPIIERENQGIVYRNTINVLQGKAGTHKSRLIEVFCSCILSPKLVNDLLGYVKYCLSEVFTLLYVDSERNTKDQFPFALQKIIKKAGFSPDNQPENFDFISLIEVAREDRLEVLKQYIDKLRETNSGHIIIVLDVITDLISNFNDPRESMKLIDYMNSLINTQNVTFLCIIHENPSSGDKARGHLGTEIMNKASLQMQIAFEKTKNNEDTDLIKVKYLKTRVGKRPEPFHLVYSEMKKSLVVADNALIEEVSDSRKHLAYIDSVTARLMGVLTTPVKRASLIEDLKDFFSCSTNTVLDRLKEIHEKQLPITDKDGDVYTLQKGKEGKETTYYLTSKDEKIDL